MQLNIHPEYPLYLQQQSLWPRCQQAIEQWRKGDIPLPVPAFGLHWSFAGAQLFVHQLVDLFQAYNEVLWSQFPYCPACGGQCCVVGASDVRAFDLLAIALLGETPPVLATSSPLSSRACVYLATRNGRPTCTWPSTWRTIKCWSFYCLGSGPWPADSNLGARYRTLTAALQAVVAANLPEPLRRYQTVAQIELAAALEDPVEFAQRMHTALDAILVAPLRRQFTGLLPAPEQSNSSGQAPNLFLVEDEVVQFVSEAMVELAETSGQLWDDLETLVWIVESRPASARASLQTMSQRYAAEPRNPLAAQLHTHLLHLLSIWR